MIRFLHKVYISIYLIVSIVFLLGVSVLLLTDSSKGVVCRFGSIKWNMNDFCTGWLITGATGTGKTVSGIGVLLHQVFATCSGGKGCESKWGGVCIDEKGVYSEILEKMAAHYGREEDLRVLSINERNSDRLNLIGDTSIRPKTYAEALVKASEAANSGARGGDAFFRDKTIFCISLAIEFIREISRLQVESGRQGVCVGLDRVAEVLASKESFDAFLKKEGVVGYRNQPIYLDKESGELDANVYKNFSGDIVHEEFSDAFISGSKLEALMREFEEKVWAQPGDQLGGVLGTIANCLSHYASEKIKEVFCRDSTFNFSDIDSGTIICVKIPQSFGIERRCISATLKFLFYAHALARFDTGATDLGNKNLLILWQDEGQRFFSEDDCNTDRIRQARATTVIATQSITSLYAQLNNEKKTESTILNLRNRIIFQASDASCAAASSTFIGEKLKKNKTQSVGSSGRSVSISSADSPIVPQSKLRTLKPHCAYVCSGPSATGAMSSSLLTQLESLLRGGLGFCFGCIPTSGCCGHFLEKGDVSDFLKKLISILTYCVFSVFLFWYKVFISIEKV